MASTSGKSPAIKRGHREKHLRIFVLESPDPLDALQGRSEGAAVEAIGRLIGHEVLTFLVRSKRELKESCRYVSSIDPEHDSRGEPNRTLCLHTSAHGNARELGFGADSVTWSDLATAIESFMDGRMKHEGRRVVVLSACQAQKQKLSSEIQRRVRSGGKRISPPAYLFCTSGDVEWHDAAVGWTVFYHMLPTTNLDDRKAVQGVLDRIKDVGLGPFVYFRWDDDRKQYKSYAKT